MIRHQGRRELERKGLVLEAEEVASEMRVPFWKEPCHRHLRPRTEPAILFHEAFLDSIKAGVEIE